MSNIEIYVIAEGQTEYTFVRDVLAPYMAPKGIYLYEYLIGKPGHKGGFIYYERALEDIRKFIKQRSDTFITTMFDYYGINPNWPGKSDIQGLIRIGQNLNSTEKARMIEEATHEKIVKDIPGNNAEKRFIPYIEMHEFEALLFSHTQILEKKTGISLRKIEKITEQYNSPEEIDDSPQSAPSKRLEALLPGYRKVAMGKVVSEAIGIPTIRNKCPHFNEWLRKMEELTGEANG